MLQETRLLGRTALLAMRKLVVAAHEARGCRVDSKLPRWSVQAAVARQRNKIAVWTPRPRTLLAASGPRKRRRAQSFSSSAIAWPHLPCVAKAKGTIFTAGTRGAPSSSRGGAYSMRLRDSAVWRADSALDSGPSSSPREPRGTPVVKGWMTTTACLDRTRRVHQHRRPKATSHGGHCDVRCVLISRNQVHDRPLQ